MKKSEVDRILGREADGESLRPPSASTSLYKGGNGVLPRVGATALEVLLGAPHKGTIKSLEGMYDATAGLVGAIGGIFNEDFKDNVGEHIAFDATDWLSKSIGYDKIEELSYLNDGKVGNFVRDAETAIGGMAPSVALSAIPYAGAVLGPVSMGMAAGGNNMEAALNKGAGYYGSWAYGIGTGLVEGATEAIGGFAFSKGGTLASKILAGTKLGKFASKGIGKVAESFISEGVEEVLADVADPALQYVTGVDKNIGENYKETAKNLPRTFLLGGTVGTIMGGGSAAVSGVRNSSRGGFKATRADTALEYISEVSKNYGNDVNKNARYDKAINGALMDISRELTSMSESQRKEYLKTMGIYKNAFNSEDGSIKAELRANINEDAVSSNLRAISGTLAHSPISADTELSEGASKAKAYVEKMLGERANVAITSDKTQNNAFYNKNEGIIYINNNAAFSGEEIAEFVAAHEVAHITEGTRAYVEMAILLDEIAKDQNAPATIKAKIGDFKARREQIRKAYAGQMKNMNVAQKEYLVDTEYNADLVGLLLGDEYFIEKLANRNLPLVEKIFKGLKNLNKKSAAVDKASAKYLNKLVNKFGKAIDNAHGGVKISQLGAGDEEKRGESGFVSKELLEKLKAIRNSPYSSKTAVEHLKELGFVANIDSTNVWSWLDNFIEKAEKQNREGEVEENRYSFVKQLPDGRKVYKTNYPENTPKIVKQRDIIDIIQNVWSKEPIELTIVDGEKEKKIIAQFNPELQERSDLSKIAFGNRKGTGSEKRITLNLSSDFYQIAKDGKYVKPKKETGKDNEAHNGVTMWHYFVTNLVYEEENGQQIDCYMNIDVKENDVGNWFYSFAIEKGVAPQTLLAVVTEQSATTPDIIISENSKKINTFDKKIDDERKSISKNIDFEEVDGGVKVSIPNPITENADRKRAAEQEQKESFRNLVENDLEEIKYRAAEKERKESEGALLRQEKLEKYEKLGVLEDDIKMLENMETLAKMDSILTVDPAKLEKTGKSPKELYAEFFESIGNEIQSKRFGSISLSNSSVHSELRHGTTAVKLATIEAIPEVIEKGQVIFDREKEGGVKRFVVCAPIKIGDNDYYMGVMLQKDAQHQRLYLHNVVSMEIKREALASEKADQVTTGAQAKGDLSMTIILQNALKVKFSDKKITTEFDEPEMSNEERQRMADEEREESGRDFYGRKSGYTNKRKVKDLINEAIDSSGILDGIGEDVAFIGKDAQKKIIGTIFSRVNASYEYNKKSFADYAARRILESVVLGDGQVYKANARLKGMMHKIDISSVEEKISKRDKLKITSRWKLREGENAISISDAVKDLNDLGYQIPMTDELQMLEEINKVYENTREYIEDEMGEELSERMGKDEYEKAKKKLADDILSILVENQTENELASKLAGVINKHQKTLDRFRDYKKAFRVDENRVRAEMAIIHHARQIKTDIKNHTYTPAQQPRFNEFKGIIAKIAKLEVRGNINRSSAKDIIADLTLWYTKENELLVDAFNEDIREDITYFRDSESKEKLLSITELYKLSAILAHLKNVFVNFGKIYRAGKWVELSEVSKKMYNMCLETLESNTGFSGILRRGAYFESPLAVAAIWDGHDPNGEFTRYVEDLQRGQLNVSVEKMKIAEKIDEFFKKDRKLFNNLVSGKLKVKCGIKVDLRSETAITDIEIPAVNLINLYLCTRTMSPEDFTLEKVGYAVKVDNSGKYQYMAPISREEIKKAYEALPAPIKELTEWVQNWNNTEGKKMKYEQDIRVNGVSNVISGDYWHLKRLHFEGINDMEKLFGARGVSHGFNKERIKQASSMLIIDNFIEAFLNHTEELFQYKYIDITIKNFDKIVQANVDESANGNERYKSVKMLIDGEQFYHGTVDKDSTALSYMTQLWKDVLKQNDRNDPFNVIVGNMRAGYASFVLGANVKVWATQFSSLIAGFGELRADSVLYGAANILRIFNPKSIAKLAQEVDEYCDWARVRHFEKGATKAMTLTDKIGKWRGIFTKPIELFDRFIVMLEYLACQNEAQKRFGLKIGTEENKIKAGELLTEVGLKTQQNQYESTKSAAIRSQNEIMKGLVMFKTDSHMVLSGLIKELSALSVLNKKIKLAEKDGDLAKVAELKKMRNQAGKKTAKYATVVMLSCAYMTLLARLFNRFYEQDKDDEMTVGDILMDLFGNFLGMFPILSEIGSFLIDGYDVDNSFYSSVNNALGAVDKTIDLFKKAISGKEITSEEAASTLRNDIYAIGQIFGVPAKNLYKNTKWVIGWFAPNAEDKMDAWFKAPSQSELEDKLTEGIKKGDERAVKSALDLLYSKYDLELKDAVLRGEYDRLMTLEVTKSEDDKTKYTPLEAKIPSNLEIDGEDVELTRKDVNTFKNALISCESTQARVVKTANYKRLGNEERAYALRKINQYYFESTKYTYTGEKSNFCYYAKIVGVEQLALIMAYVKNLKGDEADSRFKKAQTRREKIEAYIKALGLNSVKTSLALRALGYGDKENDALVTSYVGRASALTKEERAEMLEILG